MSMYGSGHPADSLLRRYFNSITEALQAVLLNEQQVSGAAELVARSLASGGVIHILGTGHSHMLAEEAFYRAGGLMAVNPILDTGLMLHESALKSTGFERLPGYAQVLLSDRDLAPEDVVIIASNSGRNAAPVEAAELVKEAGCQLIAMTSLQHSKQVPSRAPSGKKLYEIADLVIDTHVPYGDASLAITGLAENMGPLSSIVGMAALNAVLALAAQLLVSEGNPPEIIVSANVADGEQSFPHETMFRRPSPRNVQPKS